MAKIPHEALHHLFREDPGLFTQTMRRVFDERFPDIKEVAEVIVDTTSLDAVERYIDTSLRVTTDQGEEILVIEPQTEPPSPQKIRSWAWYLAFLENKYQLPTSLLILTAKEPTARACRRELFLGPPRSPVMRLFPRIVGPDNMPLITDAAEAAEDVPFAVLALLTQRLNPGVERAMRPLMDALDTLDTDTARYYAEFVEGGLGESCQREVWKQIMKTMTYGYVSELKQEFREEGHLETAVKTLLAVLDARGLDATDADRDRIRSCTDHERLLAWTVCAATASSTAEVFGD
ncbi:hypothetical protein [Glycomyces arizonensis]|uniref:hypothetical protein n=1 Tax=Glycomyces arizonensis TaxID=256035 RepID=UPI0003FA6CC9|nr:hypothetical protein [Glycomyces arizonensis]